MPIGSIFPKPVRLKVEILKPIYPGDMDYEQITELIKSEILKNLKH